MRVIAAACKQTRLIQGLDLSGPVLAENATDDLSESIFRF